jgi:hypothetical protein
MKTLYLVVVALLVSSCGSVKYHAITSKSTLPDTYYSDKTKDEVWSKTIEYFAKSGFGIKVIDKSSGLIVTDKYDFDKLYTSEDDKGFLVNKDALLVCSHYSFMNNVYANRVSGNWNIRIFEDKGKTAVNVNITNIEAKYIPDSPYYNKFECKSTGLFESKVFETVNK